MMKCYDKSTAHFLPFAKLDPKKKAEVGSHMRTTIDDLLEEMKTGKSGVEMMDFLMFRAGVKKAMLQKELNELFTSGNLHMNFLSNYYYNRAWISAALCPSFTQNLFTLS